jgi:hypothetical protein
LEASGQLHTTAALPLGKESPVLIGQEAGWAPEPVWSTCRGEKSCPYRDSNSDPSAVKTVASRYTECTIAALQDKAINPWGKGPLYPLDKSLGGPQSRSGRSGIEKSLLLLPGIETPFPGPPASILAAMPTELSRLQQYIIF